MILLQLYKRAINRVSLTLRLVLHILEVFTTIFDMHLWNISGN